MRAIAIYLLQVSENTGTHAARDNLLFGVVPRTVAITRQLASEQGTVECNKVPERICGEEAEIAPAFMPVQFSGENVDDADSSPPSTSDSDVDLAMNVGKHAPKQDQSSRE